MKTVFITGASSGIGKETAKLFSQNGWNVVATMRTPEVEKELVNYKNIEIVKCDVTDIESIKNAINKAIFRFKKIDVLVNNAGYYTVGPLETATTEQIKRQVDTNLVGLIETTKAVIPYFRKQKSGVIINLSSIAGVLSIPLQTLYHATKYAVEGFSESLQYELSQFNVKVKIIEPGTVNTEFCGRSMTVIDSSNNSDYNDYSSRVVSNLVKSNHLGSSPIVVAKTIYKAATDNRNKMRYPTAAMKDIIILRKILPVNIYQSFVKKILEK